MSDLATRTAAPLIITTSRKVGVDLPKPLAAALADADKVRSREGLDFLNGPSLTDAVADAILAGRDPLTSKDVQRAALALSLTDAGLEHRLRSHADNMAAEALRTHADALIDTWRPAVERIGAAFARFRALAPGVDPLDRDLPTGLPTNALTPWGEAKEGAALLEQITKGWQVLASIGAVYMHENTRPLIVADLSLEQLDQLGTRAQPQGVARFDVPLELASLQTFAERTERYNQARAEQQRYEADAPERARQERRQLFAMRIPTR